MSGPQFMVSVVGQKTPDKVVLYLHQKQAPPVLPYELSGHVSPDTWASRIPVIMRMMARYSNPVLEGVWFFTYFVVSIVVPAALHKTIFNALDKNHDNDNSHRNDPFFIDQDRPFASARAATLGIWFGITLLFWIPYLLFKYLARKRANTLAARWEAEDTRTRNVGAFVPTWKIKLPGFYTYQTRLILSLPANSMPTSFHPAVYQQSWINGPADGGSGYPGGPGFQTAPGFQSGGYSNPAMYGNVPLYSDEKAPAYANHGGPQYPDEQQHFDDVKV